MPLANRMWLERVLKSNVFKIGLIIEPKKLPVHSSMVRLMVEQWSNWWCHKYIIYILLKLIILVKF